MTGTIKCFNQHTIGYPLKELVLKMYTDKNCEGDYAYFSAYGVQNGNVYANFQFKKAGTISYAGLDGFASCELDAITLQNGYVLSSADRSVELGVTVPLSNYLMFTNSGVRLTTEESSFHNREYVAASLWLTAEYPATIVLQSDRLERRIWDDGIGKYRRYIIEIEE